MKEKADLEKEGELWLSKEGGWWKAAYKGEVRHSLTSMLTTRCGEFIGLHRWRDKVYAVEAPW